MAVRQDFVGLHRVGLAEAHEDDVAAKRAFVATVRAGLPRQGERRRVNVAFDDEVGFEQ